MRRRILLITHESDARPGRVGHVLRASGYETVACRPFAGDPLPVSLDDVAGVVVFGGRMSANDDHLHYIDAELRWIPRVLEAGTAFLGICLGGQLLARALGATVAAHPAGLHEIGYTEIRPTAAGAATFARPMHVCQWHSEGFALARGADLLATGSVFPHQAFRFGRAVALQFHPEVTDHILARWVADDAEFAKPGAQPREEHFAGARLHNGSVARWLSGFLDGWVGGGAATVAAE